MRKKSMKIRFVALGMSFCVLGSAFSPNIGKVYAGEIMLGDETDSTQEEGKYGILETDTKGRVTLEQFDDFYITTKYCDEQKKVIEYHTEGVFDGSNYDERIETIEYEKNQFGSAKTVTITDADGIEICEYDKNENVTRSVDKDGTVSLITYKNNYKSTETKPYTGTDEDKLYKKYFEYSDNGNMLMEKVPVQIDEKGNVLYEVGEYEYDDNRNVTCKRVVVSENKVKPQYFDTKYAYDDRNNLVKVEEYGYDGQVKSIAQYYYNENNNKVRQYTGLTDSLTINGLDDVVEGDDAEYSVVQYEYDSEGKLLKETDGNNNSISYAYDSYGNICEKKDKNGNQFKYTYRDGIFLAEEKVYYPGNKSKTPDVVKSYEQEILEDGSFGKLYKISEGDSSITRTYNVDGEINSEIDQNGNKTTYKYDQKGKVLEILLYAEDGEIVDGTKYVYNEEDQLISIKDGQDIIVCSYEYDHKNQLINEKYANGTCSKYEYDILGDMKTALTSDGMNNVIFNHKYRYTLTGNLIDDYDVLTDTGKSYRYDSTGYLNQEVSYSADKEFTENVNYAFDESGNRISLQSDTGAIKITYNALNHIQTINDEPIKYDKNGNLIKNGDVKYFYDYQNRLIKFESKSDEVEYVYDVYGKMIQRISNGEKENLVWANGKIVAIISDEMTFFHRGLEDEVKAASTEEKVYFHNNRRGDIVATSNTSGKTLETCQYDSLGNVNIETSDQLMLGFTGELYDPLSELVYLSARFYNPATGNFMTEDSIDGFEDDLQSLNRYVYCTNDPVNYTDPTGHWGSKVHKSITKSAFNNELVIKASGWADSYFNQSSGNKDLKIKLDSNSKARFNLIASKCNNVAKEGYKYTGEFHGRGDYDKYLAYIMNISFQLKAGYMVEELVLQTSDLFKQINFDLLIALPSVFQAKCPGYSNSRKNFSLLILGIGMHLVEDLWAHTATIRVVDTKKDGFSKSDFTAVNYQLLQQAIVKYPGLSYLHLAYFMDKSIPNYSILHAKYAEGGHGFETSKYLIARKKQAQRAANKLGEMYSGEITKKNSRSFFTGTCGEIIKTTITVGTKTMKTGRYKCNGGDEAKVCKTLYMNSKENCTLSYRELMILK